MSAERHLAAALELARAGFAIVSVYVPTAAGDCSCPASSMTRKGRPDRTCASPGKHPAGDAWQERATTDPDAIRELAGEPLRQLGALPRAGSRLLVVDEDVREALEALGEPLPATLTVATSKGRHVYCRLPDGFPEERVARSWAGGEIRVAGSGHVVAPWGRHASGAVYTPLGTIREVAEVPAAWLEALIASKPTRTRTATGDGWTIATGRHEDLVSFARNLRGYGISGANLVRELERRDLEHHAPPLASIGRGHEIGEIAAWADANISDDPPGITIVDDRPTRRAQEPARKPAPWPEPPTEAAYHGVAGDLVRAVADVTEADPVALLGTILATAGALFGRWATLYQGSNQAPNLFVALVGDSSTGRKGTAGAIGRAIFTAAVPGWDAITVPGLGSGEGLIARLSPGKDKDGAATAPDHRALIYETELGRLLTIMAREGSTLSPTVRDAWDGGPLGRFLARETALVLWHHVGLLAHVTPTELREKLTSVDAANGFGNRFLWLAVRRSRLLAHPRDPIGLATPYLPRLRDAITEAQRPRELDWTPAASARWDALYAALATRPRLGLAGHLTSRAEAQLARLALVYALLDRSAGVDVVHLEAAIALWEYAERSAVYIFGESTGNRHADLVLRLLRADGEVGRETIKAETGLRLGADLDAVEALLVSAGLAELVTVARPDGTARRRRVLRLIETGETAHDAGEDETVETGETVNGARAATSAETPQTPPDSYAVTPVSMYGAYGDAVPRGVLTVSPVSPVSTSEAPAARSIRTEHLRRIDELLGASEGPEDDTAVPDLAPLRVIPPEPADLFTLAAEPPCFADADDYRAHASDHYRDGSGWGCRLCETAGVSA